MGPKRVYVDNEEANEYIYLRRRSSSPYSKCSFEDCKYVGEARAK